MKPRLFALCLISLGLSGGLFGEARAQTPVDGWVEIDITTQLVTPLPSGGGVSCSGSISAIDPGSAGTPGLANSETAIATATVSGSVATCKLSLPYQWLIVGAIGGVGGATMIVDYTVEMFSGTVSTSTLLRYGTHSLPSILIPNEGVSHLFTANTKL